MTRYFMTAAEAARLVLIASVVGGNGDVMLLDLSRPERIVDLAQRMIRLEAPAVRGEIAIALGGPRPGDKLREDYDVSGFVALPSASPHIVRASLPAVEADRVRPLIGRLLRLARRGADAAVVRQLTRVVPDYRPAAPVP
jgi:O-antigen biosynthesis protein WbqV